MKALVLFAGIGQGIYCLLLFLTALFLILLILIQRGRGGGLSGAFGGGFGGQSAFGAKAGDTFTKVTIVAATFWIVLCLIGVKILGTSESVLGSASANQPNTPALSADLSADLADEGGESAEGGTLALPPSDAGETEGATDAPADATEGGPAEETTPEDGN